MTDRVCDTRSSVRAQTIPLGSWANGGSLNARLQRMPEPTRSHVALNEAGGGGLSVLGSTGSLAATGATSTSVAAVTTTTDRATRASDAGMLPSFLGSDAAGPYDRTYL
jgi:hypothetical protein